MRQSANNDEHRFRRPDNIRTWKIDAPGTLLEVASHILSDHTPTKVKSMMRHHQFAVNGTPVSQFDFMVQPGDEFSVNFDQSFRVFKHPRIQLVYEDNDILVINKGYGVLSMGTDTVKTGTAYSVMREYVKYHNPRAQVFIVHRLDRDTSGLMMLAKSQEAKDAMQHNWNNMVLDRRYAAIVEGYVEPREGIIDTLLAENSRHVVYVPGDDPESESQERPAETKRAVTRYTMVKSRNGYSLLDVSLDTGRKNQIRVHMQHIGHPIAGDRKYGAKTSPVHRLCLHARTLRFVHPTTRRDMNFEIPLPTSFGRLV